MKFLKFFLIVIILFPLSSVNAEEKDKRNKITKTNLKTFILLIKSFHQLVVG